MKKQIFLLILSASFLSACANTENKRTRQGVGIGAATGAVLGGVIGHQSGNRTEGAIIGGVLGGTIGGVAGQRMDKQAKELEKVAETRRTDQGLIAKLKSDILFDTGKADLKPSAQASIREMAAIMKKYPENVLSVNGYTDSTGSDAVNRRLSEQRAQAVREALIANGLPATTISVQGWGPANPVAENSTPAGRQQNRRVEIDVTVDESKIPAR